MLGYANQGNLMLSRYGDRPAFPEEQWCCWPTPCSSTRSVPGTGDHTGDALAEVNGVYIRNLKHLVETLRDAAASSSSSSSWASTARRSSSPERDAGSHEEILSDNGIREQCSADVAPIWNHGKAKKPGNERSLGRRTRRSW